MQINAKTASDNATRFQLARQAAAQLRENRRFSNNAAPSRIWKILQGVLEPLWRNISPYIVLAIVLIVLVILLKGGRSSGRRNNYNPISALKRSIQKN
jgi:type VI protein secretion system component VasF